MRVWTSGRRGPIGLLRTVLGLGAATILVVTFGQETLARAQTALQPTLIASAVSSSIQSPCAPGDQHCGNPGTIVAQGSPFLLTVTLSASGAPASFTKDTKLALSASGPGSLNTTTVTMPAGASIFTFTTVSYAPFANNVTVTATVAGKGKPTSIASTPSNAFTVLQSLKFDNASPGTPLLDGSGPTSCTTVTAADPICGELILPHGASTQVLLSTGACTGLGCNTSGTVTQVIADLTSGGTALYSRTDPATLVIHCYRTVCGSGGVSHLLGVAAGSTENGALNQAPPCPAKNTIGATQSYCTDQVQNSRDNADESSIYILFFDDFRGSI